MSALSVAALFSWTQPSYALPYQHSFTTADDVEIIFVFSDDDSEDQIAIRRPGKEPTRIAQNQNLRLIAVPVKHEQLSQWNAQGPANAVNALITTADGPVPVFYLSTPDTSGQRSGLWIYDFQTQLLADWEVGGKLEQAANATLVINYRRNRVALSKGARLPLLTPFVFPRKGFPRSFIASQCAKQWKGK